MSQQSKHAKSIFLDAIELANEGQRAAFIAAECGDDSELHQEVERLLNNFGQLGSFMRSGAEDTPTLGQLVSEKPGTQIGPYKLLQQIGEGGMGVVFMAEQTEPVERRIALKIIKPGMDSRQVIARFEAERQALAMMDHPNIAKVLDAGTTESGRPYFVMELVKGMPITQYCDEQHVSPRERLELFLPICQAVQHAHQKGVIHRDLKPSNVLIARYDDKAVPKIIDFGVAKAVSQRLTEKTMFTQYGQIVGTLEYMSPEQAQFNQLDVDTRSDIYSLGVLLYELLTGETPFDKQRLRSAAFDELLRIIREEEPPRPSVKLSTSESLPSIAANRDIEPHKLSTLVRGELDWIVMKALEKDRSRRYDTASAFAADVLNYLNDEAVVACPPSAAYRIRKFVHRNKRAMPATSAAMLVLIAVATVSSIAAGRFRRLAQANAELVVEKDAALITARDAEVAATAAQEQERLQRIEAERQTEIAKGALADAQIQREQAEVQRERAEANFELARSAVDEFLNDVTENQLLRVPGLQPLRQNLLNEALGFYDAFTQDEANAAELQMELAIAHYRIAIIRRELEQTESFRDSREKALALFEQLRDAGNDGLEVLLGLANCHYYAGRFRAAEPLYQQILESDPRHVEARLQLGQAYNSISLRQLKQGNRSAALDYHRRALAVREGLADDFPDAPRYRAELGATVNNLAMMLKGRHPREALAMFERAVAVGADAFNRAPEHILWGDWLCSSLNNVAKLQARLEDQEAALQALERVVAIRRKLAFENPRVPSLKAHLYFAWANLSNQQRSLGLSEEADRSLRAVEEILTNADDSPQATFNLALLYGALATLSADAHAPDAKSANDRQHYADLAMDALWRAVDGGFYSLETLESDPSLAILHEREAFQQLMKEVKALQLTASETESPEQTIADRRQGADVLRELIGDDSADARHGKALAAALHSIGVMQTELKQFNEAKQSLEEALQIRQDLQRIDRDRLDFRIDALSTRVQLTHAQRAAGSDVESHAIEEEFLHEFRQLANDLPDDDGLRRSFASLISQQVLPLWAESAHVDLLPDDWQTLGELVGDDTVLLMHRGRWYAGQAQYDQAAENFDTAIDLLRPQSLGIFPPRRAPYWAAMRWNEVYDRLLRLRGDDPDLPFEHGLFLAAHGRFDDALQAFRQGEEPTTSHLTRWARFAMLLVLNGERDEYLESCRQLQAKSKSRQWEFNQPLNFSLIATFLADSGVDAEILQTASRQLWNDGAPTRPRPARARAAGLCSLRLGDYPLALEQLHHAHQMQPKSPQADVNLFPLAIVHHQLGNPDHSRVWYDKGLAALDRWQARVTEPDSHPPFYWLMMNIFHREASELLGLSAEVNSVDVAAEPTIPDTTKDNN